MRIFLDANVLVSVLNREFPTFPFSSRIISLADRTDFQFFTSPIFLAIAFYFAEKKSGSVTAKRKIDILASKIGISPLTPSAVKLALENKRINDLEDGLEYYAALESGCQAITTEDSDDYYFSEIDVFDCEGFLERHFGEK
jgi:predicted nucleic acid-binding protein